MYSSTADQTFAPSSNLKSILDAALCENEIWKPLIDHPLATELQRCESVDSIKVILQAQARGFRQFRDGDQRLMEWVNTMADILSSFGPVSFDIQFVII